MSAENLNICFKNVPDLISSLFTGESSLLWNGQTCSSLKMFSVLNSWSYQYRYLIGSLSELLVNIWIVDSLLCIINNSLSNGTFPDDWKLARVIPFYKKNCDMNIMSNYRPISVSAHIAKMVEQWVRSQLGSDLGEHAFISTDQSAYLKGHSAQTSLYLVIDDWLKNINDNQTNGVYFWYFNVLIPSVIIS